MTIRIRQVMLRIGTAAFCLCGLAAPASAQNGAMWVDDVGRMMSMEFAGGNGPAPTPQDRSAAEMAALFKQLCLDTEGDLSRVPTFELQKASLEADPLTLPATKKAAPVTLNMLRGSGVVVSQTRGFFAAPIAQCNATFYVNSLPANDDVIAALNSTTGSTPANAASAVKKNGKPNKNYTPEWTATVAGQPGVVAAFVAEGDRYMPGKRVQISARVRKKAK